MKQTALILSCEHATNRVPRTYLPLFKGHEAVLDTHEGIDLGADKIASALQKKCHCPYFKATVSRLIIDCNRRLNNPHRFSRFTMGLPDDEKQTIQKNYYIPYRKAIIEAIDSVLEKKQTVVHVSVHSFTPSLSGIPRNNDIGLLYDPKRPFEKKMANDWQQWLNRHTPFKTRKNYPYRGTSDGLTTALRKRYPSHYIGFELELNQAVLADENQSNLCLESLIQWFQCYGLV